MTTSIVVCGILRDEVAAALRAAGIEVPVVPVAPAPCIDQPALRRQLEAALARAGKLSDDVLVVIGRCHPEVDEILAAVGARRLDVNDCFEALLGRSERQHLDREANNFYTLATWLPHWRRAFEKGMRWDPVDVRQNFARYERVLLLDTGLHRVDEEEVLRFFDAVGVPVEVRPVGLDRLRELLVGAIVRAEQPKRLGVGG